jgi:hypothetical protein
LRPRNKRAASPYFRRLRRGAAAFRLYPPLVGIGVLARVA